MKTFKENICWAVYHLRRCLGKSDGTNLIIFFGCLSMLIGLNFILFNPQGSFWSQILNIISFLLVIGVFLTVQLQGYLWRFFATQLISSGVKEIFYLDRESLLKDWIFNYEFSVIKDPQALVDLAVNHYQGDRLRTNSEFFLSLISDPCLSAQSRGLLIEKYYSHWASPSYNFESHRIEVFKKILGIPLEFSFPGGCEKFFTLFESTQIRETMAQKGWTHKLMNSFIGEDYYLYNAPSLYLIEWSDDFNSFYNLTIGRQPKLKQWMQENLIDRESKKVKWKYFQFLQVNYFFNFNYDVLFGEMKSSLEKGDESPFLSAHVFQDFSDKESVAQGIAYLKQHYSDQRLLRLLKTVGDKERFLRVLELIQSCLEKKHSPYLPKKVKSWHELLELTEEEVRKIQQGDFFLHQFAIYSWDRAKILDYEILVPRSNFRLIREGTRMRNCVGNGDYVKAIINGDTLIFFLVKDKKVQVCVDLKKDDFKLRTIKFRHNQEVPLLLKEAVESFIGSKIAEYK